MVLFFIFLVQVGEEVATAAMALWAQKARASGIFKNGGLIDVI